MTGNAKLLVFDLDDTLFCEKEFVRSGFSAVGEWMQRSLGALDFYEVATGLFERGARGNIFNLALGDLGIEEDPVLIQKMIEVYRTHEPVIQLYEDAQWALSHFSDKPNDRALGIITDGYLEVQKRKARALKVTNYVDTILYTDFYGRENWKPSPVPYQEMMRLTGFLGTSCIYVGDNPKKDFVTAKALGWQTIQISRADGEYSDLMVEAAFQADVKIDSLYDLAEIV